MGEETTGRDDPTAPPARTGSTRSTRVPSARPAGSPGERLADGPDPAEPAARDDVRPLTLTTLLAGVRLVVTLAALVTLAGADTWWAVGALAGSAVLGAAEPLVAGTLGHRAGHQRRVRASLDAACAVVALVVLVGTASVPWWAGIVLLGAALWPLASRWTPGRRPPAAAWLGAAASACLSVAAPLLVVAHGPSSQAALSRPLAWALVWWAVPLGLLADALLQDDDRSAAASPTPRPVRPAGPTHVPGR